MTRTPAPNDGRPAKYSGASLIGQWAALAFCVAGGSASVAITAMFNVGFGLAFGQDIAAVFLFVAFMVAGMPLLAAYSGGWTIGLRGVWALALALSITAGASHVFEMQADAWGAAEAGKAKASNHAGDEQRARAALDRITETADVGALAAQVETAEGKLAEEAKAASDAKIECSKRKKCDAATMALQTLRERHGQAKARDEYKAELAALKAAGKASAPAKAIGMGESIAKLTGADAGRVNALVGAIVLSLVLALLEMSSSVFAGLAGKLGVSIAAAKRARRKAETLTKAEKVAEAEAAGEIVVAPKTAKDEALLKVQLMIFHAPGERLVMSQNAIAKAIGVNATTFRTWAAQWKRDGLIWIEGKGRKAALCTVRKAAA